MLALHFGDMLVDSIHSPPPWSVRGSRGFDWYVYLISPLSLFLSKMGSGCYFVRKYTYTDITIDAEQDMAWHLNSV